MREMIITDLTRFAKPDHVCTALIDVNTGECLRPRPYLRSDRCKELNLHPGAILHGDMELDPSSKRPHVEDASYSSLKYVRASSTDTFKSLLDGSLSSSVSTGFGLNISMGQKHIPIGQEPDCSILTVRVDPRCITIHEDSYKPGKVKCSFVDSDGHQFRYLAITDRGFFDFAKAHQADDRLSEVGEFLGSQDEIYLRIGLSRVHKVDERNGYWLQVNGIYTFPRFLEEIRSYE